VVLLDVRSSSNVGQLLRTADAVACEKFVCVGITPSPDGLGGAKVRKVSLGAERFVDVVHCERWADAKGEVRRSEERSEELSAATFALKILSIGTSVQDVPSRLLFLTLFTIRFAHRRSKGIGRLDWRPWMVRGGSGTQSSWIER